MAERKGFNQMTHDLKVCPLCGGTPYIESRSRAYVKGETKRVAYVRCMSCAMRTGKIPLEGNGEAKAVQIAINRWNMRFNGISLVPVSDHR